MVKVALLTKESLIFWKNTYLQKNRYAEFHKRQNRF